MSVGLQFLGNGVSSSFTFGYNCFKRSTCCSVVSDFGLSWYSSLSILYFALLIFTRFLNKFDFSSFPYTSFCSIKNLFRGLLMTECATISPDNSMGPRHIYWHYLQKSLKNVSGNSKTLYYTLGLNSIQILWPLIFDSFQNF